MANKDDLQRVLDALASGERVVAPGADLRGANLSGADLHLANLSGADLSGADLSGADLSNATLDRANLTGANLINAMIGSTTLVEANLSKADLRRAALTGSNLRHAILSDADLSLAVLVKVFLDYTELSGANLTRADLYQAVLVGANLAGANLRRAHLAGANLKGASFKGATLDGAYCQHADLRGADFSNASMLGVNLRDAHLDGADLTGAKISYHTSPSVLVSAGLDIGYGYGYVGSLRALGKHAGPVLKLRKHGAMPAREFKRQFPAEFERIKPLARGRDFTPEVRAELITVASGPEWAVFSDSYTFDEQRLCPDPNSVIMLGIQVDTLPEHLHSPVHALAEASRRSDHPVISKPGYLTVGWVRYCGTDDNVWLVEEVQSDLDVVRYKKPEGIIEHYEELLEVVRPWLDRFYEDALAILFDYAQRAGVKVEMLTHESKKEHGAPRSVYEDLPRRMGMTRAPKSAVLPKHPVWEYTPNRSSRWVRRRRIRLS